MHLPPEIRIDIYKLSFISHSTITFCQHHSHRPGLLCGCGETTLNASLQKSGPLKDVHPQFIRTRCQLHAEAVSMLYGRFHFPARTISSASTATLNLQRLPHSVMPRSATVLLFPAEATTSGESPGDVQSRDLCLDSLGDRLALGLAFLPLSQSDSLKDHH